MKIIEQLINEALKETNINVPRQEINHFKFKIIDEILYSIKNSDVAINIKLNGLVMSNFFKSCPYNESNNFNNNFLKRINKFYLIFLFKFAKCIKDICFICYPQLLIKKILFIWKNQINYGTFYIN